MKLLKWFNRKMSNLMFSLSKVEQENLTQGGISYESDSGQYQRINQGRLSDSLLNAEVTQEVKELRWRMYKVLKATDGVTAKIVGYDDDGMPIVEVRESKIHPLKKVKVDSEDSYNVVMVVDNSEITLGSLGGSDINNIKEIDGEDKIDKDGDKSRTIAETTFEDMESSVKNERPITIIRSSRPKFDIEKYTKKLIIRKINETEFLLEFYISKYVDNYNRKSRLFISECKKVFTKPKFCNMLDIDGLSFITNKTMGSKDFLFYEYSNLKFDKIIEFGGDYVIKFKSTISENGLDILEVFREKGLDDKYDKKQIK